MFRKFSFSSCSELKFRTFSIINLNFLNSGAEQAPYAKQMARRASSLNAVPFDKAMEVAINLQTRLQARINFKVDICRKFVFANPTIYS